MKNILHYTIFVLLASLCFINAVTYIDECGTLSSAGETYILNSSIEQPNSANCLSITADNITLDCDGYSITKTGATSNFGITLTSNNTTVQKCNIINFYYGIKSANSINNNILNNSLLNCSYSLRFDNVNYTNIYNNIISNSNIYSILLMNTYYCNVSNNLIQNSTNNGIHLSTNTINNTVNDNIIIFGENIGLFIYWNARNNSLNNNIICFNSKDVADNSLASFFLNSTYDIYNSGSDEYYNKTSPCPSIISADTLINPSSPESSDNLFCQIENLTLNPNQDIDNVYMNLTFEKDGVYYSHSYTDCIDEDCFLKVSWLKTSSGENWTCSANPVFSSYYDIEDTTETLDASDMIFEFDTDENIFSSLVTTFNTTYLFWLLPLFAMGVIGLISRKISTTALGTGVLCIPMFIFFTNTTFIFIAVVLFIGGLGAKKMGF